jgi:nucleoside-diphosphate-sugar epimerase
VEAIKSLLLTGGSGFVGQSFLDFLSELPKDQLPRRIGLTSRSKPIHVSDALRQKTEIIDLSCNLQKPWEFEFEASHIVNLAADGTESSYSNDAGNIFIDITKNLSQWSKNQKNPIVFHASSGAVYGKKIETSVQTKHTTGILAKHSIANSSEKKKNFIASRVIAERNLQALNDSGDIQLRIGRLFSFIGRHLQTKPQYAINSFVRMATTLGEITITGNPNTTRGYLGAKDMAYWIYRTLYPEVSNGIFDIGSSTPVTMWEMANFIGSKYGARVALSNSNMELDDYLAYNADTLKKLKVTVTEEWQPLMIDYLDSHTKEMRIS